jgi:cyclic-di-AMP phosphodiesterase PgpH
MIIPLARLLERYFDLPSERAIPFLSRVVVLAATMTFLLTATVIVAFDHLFPGQGGIGVMRVGDVADRNIYAPESRTYISSVLTEQLRTEAQNEVRPIYNSPDLDVARTQTRLVGQILDYIENVRRDPFATPEQRISDLRHITALTLDETSVQNLTSLTDEAWTGVRGEITRLLEQVMQESIRDIDLQLTRERLPIQVSFRFDDAQIAMIADIVGDLVRPNTTENVEATERARQAAGETVTDQPMSFRRGQIVVRGGEEIGELEYEALNELGLLQPEDQRVQEVVRSFIAVTLVTVMMGLYLARFRKSLLYTEPRLLALLAAIFVLVLFGARLALGNEIYLFPAALLGLLYVAVVSPQVALVGSVSLGLLVGLMANNSLEVATLVVSSGVIGSLTLRRAERLNSYFVTGLVVALTSMIVAAMFNLSTDSTLNTSGLPTLMLYGILNGVLTAAAAVIGLYLIGLLFNMTTALKLIELSQPNQPLLQRLLREAPGTYQHSLQVANLSEQAASAIGANSSLVHVAALYHDIGKMLNPAFFTENQRDIGNPHDTLNDPYRSADIIISHVTEGDEMARQYRLPRQIRDFIREHHGTTQVFVFYKQAVIQAGDDEAAVDITDFSYPGPKPQTRESAILMLADSCEATIRSTQPGSKQEIEVAVDQIIEGKRREGQLDECGLTLNDLNTIKRIFVDMLKATFHPRINYSEAVAKARGTTTVPALQPTLTQPVPKADPKATQATPAVKSTSPTQKTLIDDDDDDSPLPYVPLLPRNNGKRDTMEVRAKGEQPLPKPAEPDATDEK